MDKKIGLTISLIVMSCILTGCWDSVEINNRSILLEFAIDKNTNYTYEADKTLDQQGIYQFIYTIPDFGKLSGTESLAKDVETNIVVEAASIGASLDDLGMKSKDSISFSHVKALFLGEELLKDRDLFKRTIDGLSRDRVIARNVPLLVTNGPVEATTKVENSEQPILGLYILDYFKNKERPNAYVKQQLLGNFIRELDETGISTLPLFHVEKIKREESPSEGKEGKQEDKKEGGENQNKETPADEIDIHGGAVIRDYELVDYLTKEQVKSMLFVEGKIKNAPIMINYEDQLLSYVIRQQTCKVKFEDTREGPKCILDIKTIGDIIEYPNEEGLFAKDEAIDHIEKDLSEAIKSEVGIGIERAKAINVDFMHLGLQMYRKYPNMWKKYKAGWEAGYFIDMPIEVVVNVDIESTGMQH